MRARRGRKSFHNPVREGLPTIQPPTKISVPSPRLGPTQTANALIWKSTKHCNFMSGANLPLIAHQREIVLVCGLTGDVGGNTCKQTVQCFPIKK
jgi:hypothetical protein